MTTTAIPRSPSTAGLANDPALSVLARRLVELGFTVTAVEAALGAPAAAALDREDAVPARRAVRVARSTGSLTAVHVLLELFLLGDAVDEPELESTLGTATLRHLRELGLVTVSPQPGGASAGIRAAFDLRPIALEDERGPFELYVVSDLGELATGRQLATDHVLGVGGASLTLAGLQFASPVDRVLDLGTGCGIQALVAARRAREVVATDVSQRALDIARANVELNRAVLGDVRVEFRLGSLFEPVTHEGLPERFDRIVSNPPFVITPRTPDVPAYEYRDGGREGDALVADVITGLRDHLAPGGTAQLLANWEYRTPTTARSTSSAAPPSPASMTASDRAAAGSGDGLERMRAWVGPLHAWVIERERLDAAQYAETWIRDGGTVPGTPEYTRMLDAWLDDFARRDVDAVGFGYVLLAAPAAAHGPVQRLEQVGAAAAGPLGHALERAFGAAIELAGIDDARLALLALTVAADVTEERHLMPGEDDPTAILLRQGGALGRVASVGTATAAAVGACDGELTVGAIIAALADLLDAPAESVAAEVVPMLRELTALGMLTLPEQRRGAPPTPRARPGLA